MLKSKYCQCMDCGCIFLVSMPNKKKLSNYYKNCSNLLNKQQIKRIRSRAKQIIKQILKIRPKSKTILDIGCGPGYFLDEAKKKGFQVYGIEPSIISVRNAKKNYGLEICNGFLDKKNLNKFKTKFDVIILSHIIEHLRNPKEFMFLASNLLRKGGIIYIETPNINSWLAEIEQENYTFLTPPEHLCLYSKKSIFELIKRVKSKLSLEKIETFSYSEHLIGILKILLKQFKKPNLKIKKEIQVNEEFKLKPKSKQITIFSNLKYIFFNRLLSPILTPLLNLNNKGSILALYFRKKA